MPLWTLLLSPLNIVLDKHWTGTLISYFLNLPYTIHVLLFIKSFLWVQKGQLTKTRQGAWGFLSIYTSSCSHLLVALPCKMSSKSSFSPAFTHMHFIVSTFLENTLFSKLSPKIPHEVLNHLCSRQHNIYQCVIGPTVLSGHNSLSIERTNMYWELLVPHIPASFWA